LNALENTKDNWGLNIRNSLDSMGQSHHYIVSAFANQESYKVTYRKQSQTVVISLQGGMNQVCLDFLFFILGTHVNRKR
jgi:hypothetical protein